MNGHDLSGSQKGDLLETDFIFVAVRIAEFNRREEASLHCIFYIFRSI